eukprot:6239207-Alexandrium_andersonii.AAC.1
MGSQTADVEDSRERFSEFAKGLDAVLANTFFPKRDEHLAKYLENKAHAGGPPYDRTNYEVLDYVVVPRRWGNAIKDVTADPRHGVGTDHYPLIAKIS